MMTSHGPRCDVCGDYILLDISVNPFSVRGIEAILLCHDACRPIVEHGRWDELPDGPLRDAYLVACEVLP